MSHPAKSPPIVGLKPWQRAYIRQHSIRSVTALARELHLVGSKEVLDLLREFKESLEKAKK